jgi:hypothetical protein
MISSPGALPRVVACPAVPPAQEISRSVPSQLCIRGGGEVLRRKMEEAPCCLFCMENHY